MNIPQTHAELCSNDTVQSLGNRLGYILRDLMSATEEQFDNPAIVAAVIIALIEQDFLKPETFDL